MAFLLGYDPDRGHKVLYYAGHERWISEDFTWKAWSRFEKLGNRELIDLEYALIAIWDGSCQI